MLGGFKVGEMWRDPDDRFGKFDAIAVILNRLKVIMVVVNLILVIVAIIVAVIVVIFKGM